MSFLVLLLYVYFIVDVIDVVVLAVSSCFSLDMTVYVDVVILVVVLLSVVVVLGVAWFHEIKLYFFATENGFFFSLVGEYLTSLPSLSPKMSIPACHPVLLF
jgi:hypothetical protein